MKEYFLQSGVPGFNATEEEQTIVDETQVNEAFEPASDAFSGLREAGDWLFDVISNFITQVFGNIF